MTHWDEFNPHYFSSVSSFARTWATDTIRRIRSEFEDSNGLYRDSILKELLEIENKIPDIQYAFEDETEGDGARGHTSSTNPLV
ncbi:hypothetical protein N7497_005825 [Penicillium chrysogenum]|nr:hypothetical protein N7497_005825 [Penicillium chrysogenum]